MPGPVRLSDSGESDNRLHTMGNGTSFFSRHGTSLQRMHMPHGPKYRQSTLHSLYSKTSAQPEDARFDKYGHPWIYPLDGAR